MDDDQVLRSLSADLERDDPALAALLSDRRQPHSRLWVLLAVPLLLPALLLPAHVVLGLAAMLLILGSPAFVCWLCAAAEDSAPRHT
jgi:hypothetical protein